MRSGVALQPVDPVDVYEDMVEEIETLGYDELWMTDSSLHARYVWVYLTLAARATRSIQIGTAVTNPVTRHPAITAIAASTVDEVSHGRAVLGIGAGDRPLLSLGLKPARLATLEASIAAIRGLWAGEHVEVEAPGFALHDAHMREGGRADIPVYMSATGPKTLELAGRVADGVILLAGLHPDGVRWAIDHIDRGVSEAGRDRRPKITVFAYGAIDEDEDRALEAARTIAAWFPQTAPVYCEMAGLSPELIAQVQALYAGGEFQEAAAAARLLPDDFVHRMALGGDRSRAIGHLRNMQEIGVDAVAVFPLGDDRRHTIREFRSCIEQVSAESGG